MVLKEFAVSLKLTLVGFHLFQLSFEILDLLLLLLILELSLFINILLVSCSIFDVIRDT